MSCTLILSRSYLLSPWIFKVFRSTKDLFSVDAIIWKINYVVGVAWSETHIMASKNIRLTAMWLVHLQNLVLRVNHLYLRNHNTIVVYYILKQDDLVWNRHRNKLNRKKNEKYRSLNIVQVIRDTFSHCALALWFVFYFEILLQHFLVVLC